MPNQDQCAISERIKYIVFEQTGQLFSDTIVTLPQLENEIFRDIDLYCENKGTDNDLNKIFHKIQIWGGVTNKVFYKKDSTHGDFSVIKENYKKVVDECVNLHFNIEEEPYVAILKKLTSLLEVIKQNKMSNIGPTCISKHVRFWTHFQLRDNALPLYNNSIAYYYTRQPLPRENYLVNFWLKLIYDKNREGKSLLIYERYLLDKYNAK